ncbi:SpoIIE family protein phosphatase/ATP-binding protein [Streptomyces colonosanans]|uniref:Histidine kinase n=1 Tax=Streptomyces colonosanans TaxID=1428652 RepID=A0A1S2PA06_9ACTN|nr:SpoIIE family protein phosphatase/ATP-binding protein [Streptomyces colonosanans]OIJ90467.1 histidine kinase [Streptomyces colonosanans]
MRLLLNPRSIAGQVFFLQAAIVLLIIASAVLALVFLARSESFRNARDRSVTAAEMFAHAPGIQQALKSPNPTAVLQPLTEAARKRAEVSFIVVADTHGIRYTQTNPTLIGKRVVANIGPVLAGHTYVENVHDPLGSEIQATAPVIDARGRVVGMVTAGVQVSKVNSAVYRQLPILAGGGAAALAATTVGTALAVRRVRRQTRGLGPAEITRMYEHHDAVLHSVREGVFIADGGGSLLLANDEAHRLLDLPPNAEGRPVADLGLDPDMTRLLVSGRVATDEVHVAGDRLLAVNQRPTDLYGGPPGSVATLRDTTELHVLSGRAEVARERLKLLYDASVCIGTTLDARRTAEELAEVTVPRFADFVSVDLVDPILRGEEPVGTGFRRTALKGIRDGHPLYPPGQLITFGPSTPHARALDLGQAIVVPRLSDDPSWWQQDAEWVQKALAYGFHSLLTVPLRRARGAVLGVAAFWRSERPSPFDADDLALAEELVARAAVCIDNARRFTHEHTLAVTLQRSLLPRGVPEQDAVEVASRYVPAQAGVGGDWFDVIPLPGARVALVVGDVVGHGVHAAATMGRLRIAVRNFSALDLSPGELLSHLDELVTGLDQDEEAQSGGEGITGATCLYAIYDPVTGRATVARAGHPGPALVHPDGTVAFPEVPASPPLGLGGEPFETAELQMREGSRLVLYTDGLIEGRDRDIDTGLALLRAALANSTGRSPEEICTAVCDTVLPQQPSDDIALLVARTRLLPSEKLANWDVPSDAAAVSQVRAACARQLETWGLEGLGFTTELILSELVTNAIRHGCAPIQVRILCDRSLICEVSDGSSTSPHLRRARATDEGGRGLFLVAQCSERWGTRYTARGKVIWVEQSLTGSQQEMTIPLLDELDELAC